jgi:hypothetical protein
MLEESRKNRLIQKFIPRFIAKVLIKTKTRCFFGLTVLSSRKSVVANGKMGSFGAKGRMGPVWWRRSVWITLMSIGKNRAEGAKLL